MPKSFRIHVQHVFGERERERERGESASVTEMRVTLLGPLIVTAPNSTAPCLRLPPSSRGSPIDSCAWTIATLTFALQISLQRSLSLLNFNSDCSLSLSFLFSLSLSLSFLGFYYANFIFPLFQCTRISLYYKQQQQDIVG